MFRMRNFLVQLAHLQLVLASSDLDPCTSLDAGLPDNVTYVSTYVPPAALNITSTRYNNTSPLCRVVGAISYGNSSESKLNFELWLPEKDRYNLRYVSVGNGGFAGDIDYTSMLDNVNKGFAVGGCDSGHSESENGDSTPGTYVEFLQNRDKTLAWIHNSIATFTKHAEQLVTAYYAAKPDYLYYAGCSTGGAQGFALAQYHPEIFDGIYAGSPGNHYSHLILSFLWNGVNSNVSTTFLGEGALELITNSVIDACDTIDGTEDSVLDDPTQCDFDVFSLLCDNGQSPTSGNTTVCLTAPQIENAQKFYAGPADKRSQRQVYPGFAFGSERQWVLQEESLYLQYSVPLLQNLVFGNLSYDYTTFDWGSDIDIIDERALPLIDEISPNLTAFRKRGGKMIVTQGWADPYNAPYWPIQHRDQMHEIFGDELSEFYTLFMIPGGGHCGAAAYGYENVPATYQVFDRLIPWVEQGQKPQDLLTTNPPDGSNVEKVLYPYK